MKNIDIVTKFLKDRKLSDHTIIGLEVLEQVFNGQYKKTMGNQIGCKGTLTGKFIYYNDYTGEDEKAWQKVRTNLKPEDDFVASILPESIKDDATNILRAYADLP